MNFTRRSLLRGAGLTALASPFALPLLARAGATKRLVVVFAAGGWDVTYCMDPKIGLRTIDGPDLDEDKANVDDREAIQTFGSSPIAVNPVKRPAVSTFFETWGPQTTVVNGVWVGSIAHDVNTQRVLTGSRTNGMPDMAAIGGYELGASTPIPYLALGGSTFVGELAAYSGRSGRTNQLRYLLDPSLPYGAPPDYPFRGYPQMVPSADERDRIEAYLAGRAATLRQARGQSGRGAARLESYQESLTRSRDLLADGTNLADNLVFNRGTSLRSRVDAALPFLEQGISHTVSMDSGNTWDTHTNSTLQHGLYDTLFTDLDYLMTQLDARSMLDDTLVWVVSEMTRTPRRNDTGGKDHWSVTSSLLMGGGIDGGRTLGGTDELLNAVPVATETGEPWDQGSLIRYDELAAGLLAMLDVDPDAWLPGVTPLGGLSG